MGTSSQRIVRAAEGSSKVLLLPTSIPLLRQPPVLLELQGSEPLLVHFLKGKKTGTALQAALGLAEGQSCRSPGWEPAEASWLLPGRALGAVHSGLRALNTFCGPAMEARGSDLSLPLSSAKQLSSGAWETTAEG